MSGTMQPPMAPPMGGQSLMPPQGGGTPQLPPQVLQMLMQRMQGGQGAPPMPPPGGPQAMPPPGQNAPPQPGDVPPRMMPPGAAPQEAQQLAQQGRFGDSLIAHVTPGEVSIPPQVQTPQLMQAIREAFAKFGINPAQFTAGSPATSHNPSTGAPELSFWSAILPVLGAGAGSLIPGVGTAVGAGVGGALGGAAGGVVDHANSQTMLLQALGGGAGGYLGGSAAGASGGGAGTSAAAGGAAPATAAGSVLPGASTVAPAAASTTENAGANALLAAPGNGGGGMISGGSNPFASAPLAGSGALPAAGSGGMNIAQGGLMGQLSQAAKPGLYAGLGAAGAGMLAPPSNASILPAGFNKPLPPLNPNFGQLNGSGQANRPTFQGYNPYQSVSGPNAGYNFFPQS